MKVEPIPNFHALAFKEEAQMRVRAELGDLQPQEKLRRLHDRLNSGPLADWWRTVQSAQKSPATLASLGAIAPEGSSLRR